MWRSWHLGMMFPHILNSSAVGEFILIDNNRDRRPAALNTYLTHPKLRLVDPGFNTYVNPGWNRGMQEAKWDQICILSDDIIFDHTIFQQLVPHVLPTAGVFGLEPESINCNMKVQIGKLITIREMPTQIPPLGFGCLMFLHKAATTTIPEDFKIFYGDNWLCCYNAIQRHRPNYLISNTDTQTRFTTTSGDIEFQPLHIWERSRSEDIFAKEFGEGVYDINTEIELASHLRERLGDSRSWASRQDYDH